MSQKRTYDYGDLVNSQDDNEIRQYLLPAGVYSGFALGVDASADLTVGPGVGLLPDGIAWQEDTLFVPATFTPPGAATNYTLVATHIDRMITSGTAVEYAIQAGLTATVANGVVLGWIYHPGGGVALAATMLVNALDRRAYDHVFTETRPLELRAPLPRTYSDTAAMGANIVFSGQQASDLLFDLVHFVNYQRVAKLVGPAGNETLVQHIQFFAGEYRPRSFDFFVDIPGGASIVVELRDTDLNTVTLTSGTPITTTVGWETKRVVVDRTDGVFASGSPYELRLTHTVDVTQEIKLAHVFANFYPYPL